MADRVDELKRWQAEIEMQRDALNARTEELARSRALYFRNFEAGPIPVFRLSAAGEVLEANLAGRELLGLSQGRIPTQGAGDLSDGRIDGIEALITRALASETPVSGDVRMRSEGLGDRIFAVTAVGLSEGGKPQVLAYFQDDTEARQRSEEFERLSLLARATENPVVFTDAERRIVWVNDAFEQITGYTRDEVRGRNPSFLQGPKTDAATIERMRRALDHGLGFHETVLNYSKSGREYLIHIEVVALRGSDGGGCSPCGRRSTRARTW